MRGLVLSTALVLLVSVPAQAQIVVDFDDVSASSSGSVFPGTQYAGSGVTFTSADLVGAGGGNVALSNTSPDFLVIGNGNSISPPNFAAAVAVAGNPNDLFMAFDVPVTSVSVTPDDAAEGSADPIRLYALAATATPGEYEVLQVVSQLDDVEFPMVVNGGGQPFSFAAFEVTIQAEGFDDLTFQPTAQVPSLSANGTIGLVSILALAGGWSLVRRRSC